MWHLTHPLLLLLGLAPAAAAVYFLSRRRRYRPRFVALFSGPQTVIRSHLKKTRWAFRLLFAGSLLGFGLLLFAAARPYLSRPLIQRFGEGIDILIALDVSESMDATDLLPSRIEAAKKVIREFIEGRPDDRIGIVLFSGEAVTRCPLTTDHAFLLSQVDEIQLRELKQGTAIGMGLANAVSRLRKSESKTKVIILLTDGDSNVGAINPITATHLARQEKIKIYTVGIGQANRVVIPIYSYDSLGRKTQLLAQVPSYLNPELLAEIAQLTGGKTYMGRDSSSLGQILRDIDRLEKSKIKLTRTEQRDELFLFPTLAGLALLLLLWLLQETRFRKGALRGSRV